MRIGTGKIFDLIYVAAAFHWIPEEYGYKRVYSLSKHGGAFARFAYHAGKDKKRQVLTAEIEELYKKYKPQSGAAKEFCETDAEKIAEVAGKYGFVDLEYRYII